MGGGASVIAEESTADFPTLGLSLSYYPELFALCGGKDALKHLSTGEVCEKFIKPITSQSQSSFCSWLGSQGHPGVGKAQVYVSHAWSLKFLDVIETLCDHFEETPDVIIWFDVFSVNQHQAQDHSVDWLCNVLKPKIAAMKHTVLVLTRWYSTIPLQRSWCLFELFCTIEGRCKLDLAFSKREKEEILREMFINTDQQIKNSFGCIDFYHSETTVPADRESIFTAVKKTLGDIATLNDIIYDNIRSEITKLVKKAHVPVVPVKDDEHLSIDKEGRILDEDVRQEIVAHVEAGLGLGSLYVSEGEFDKAEATFLECLQVAKKELGDDHTSANVARNHLALLYETQGKYDDAEDLLLFVLKLNQLAQQAFDDEQAQSTTAHAQDHHNHIDLTVSQEEAEAKTLKKKNKLRNERIRTMSNLASVYIDQEKFDLALEVYQSCYKERLASILEIDEEKTVNMLDTTVEEITTTTTMESPTVFEKVHSKSSRSSSRQTSPRLLISPRTTDKGSETDQNDPKTDILAEEGVTDKSVKVRPPSAAPVVLTETQRIYRRYQEEWFAIMNNLAMVYEKLQMFDDAEHILLTCITAQEKALGKNHPDTLMTEANLAGVYFGQNKYVEAEPWLLRVLDKRVQVLGQLDPLTLTTMQSLAMTYFSQGKYAEAEDILIPCLEMRKKVLGDAHPQTIDTLSTLAMVFSQQEKTDEAEVFFVLSYETQRDAQGKTHPDTLEYMYNLAVFYHNIGEKARAESLARECWALCETNLGVEHPLTISVSETFPFLLSSEGKDTEENTKDES